MFISEQEAEQRLNSEFNILRRRENDKNIRMLARVRLPEHPEDGCAIAPVHNGGRRPGDRNLTPESRAEIGAAAQIDTLSKVAEDNNVSLHHAHELSQGKHSNAQGTNPELVDDINKKLDGPHDIALKKLTASLLAIDEVALTKQKPKDLAAMASQLARVAEHTAPIKHTSPEEDALRDCRLVVYSPTIKNESYYKTVQIISPVQAKDV